MGARPNLTPELSKKLMQLLSQHLILSSDYAFKKNENLIERVIKRLGEPCAAEECIYYPIFNDLYPIYYPTFEEEVRNINLPSYDELGKGLLDFIRNTGLDGPLEHEISSAKLKQDPMFYEKMKEIKISKIKKFNYHLLVALAFNTKTFINNVGYLQLIVDFVTYTFFIDDRNENYVDVHQIMDSNAKVISYLTLAETLDSNAFPEFVAANDLGSRLKTIIERVYESSTDFRCIISPLIESLMIQFENALIERVFDPQTLSRKEYIQYRLILMGILPPLKCAYIMIGDPKVDVSHSLISELEHLVSLSVLIINDLISLPKEFLDKGFTPEEVKHFYTSKDILHAKNTLPTNYLTLTAIENKVSLQEAIFITLQEFYSITKQINSFIQKIPQHAVFNEKQNEAIEILKYWPFANIIWSFITERYFPATLFAA